MGLKETFQKAAKTAVTAFGNVAVSTNYEQYASTTYNASSGSQVVVFATVSAVSIIFERFEFAQIDGVDIKAQDKKALVPQNSISAITPKTTDRITQGGIVWNIVNVRTDPAGALHEIHVRRS